MAAASVVLYGELRKYGRLHRPHLDSNTVGEAIRYLSSQFDGFRSHLYQAKDRGIGFVVFRGNVSIGPEKFHEPVGGDVIKIVPVIMGSKRGGVGQIIVGAVIIIVSAVIDAYTDGAFGKATNYSTYAMGASMIIGGVVQMLTPLPKGGKGKDSSANEPSYVFSGSVNTQAQGNPVPLLYGRMIVGSAVISAGINAEDYAPASSGVGPGTPGHNPKTPYDA